MEAVHNTELLIIGSGLSGMSAAVFAANRDIRAVVAGGAGGFEYSSGLMDLWGLSLTQKDRITKKPWDMLERLSDEEPDHPLARIKKETIQAAFYELTTALKKQGLTYSGHEEKNTLVMTPFGTLRPTFRLPPAMRSNSKAFQKKEPCLILDFKGLREFSAIFVKEMMKNTWKGLRAMTLEFPDTHLQKEVFTPFLARSLETEQVQDKFLTLIRSAVKDETWLGLPAILGIYSSEKILKRLEAESGLRIFEIPTSPVSVPGIRLWEALMKSLENTSVTLLQNQRVTKITPLPKEGFQCRIESDINPVTLHAKAILLATGRFLGGGLSADQKSIHEPLLGLPLYQPKTRNQWHSQNYFDLSGHEVNRAGIRTDDLLRPVTQDNRPVFETLFASGTVLAHQDWVRARCGSALSIATGFKAIDAYLKIRQGVCKMGDPHKRKIDMKKHASDPKTILNNLGKLFGFLKDLDAKAGADISFGFPLEIIQKAMMFDMSILYKVSNVINDRLILEIVKILDPKGLRPELYEGKLLRLFLDKPDKQYVNEVTAFLTKEVSFRNVPGEGCDIMGYVYLPDSFGGAYLFGGDFFGKESAVSDCEVAGVEIMCNFLSTVLMKTQFQQQAEIDHLTGLFNSFKIKQKADHVVRRFERKPLSCACIAMGDIDYFKKINDTYGHIQGDLVLKKIGEVLFASMREVFDMAGRFGGEEFLLIFDETDEANAVQIVERLRKTIEATQFKQTDKTGKIIEHRFFHITMSFGIARLTKDSGIKTAADWIARADAALYESKARGRNRTTLYQEK